MNKLVKNIGILTAIAGAFAAVCVTDGSAHEVMVRLCGVAAFIAGIIIASATSNRASHERR